MARALQTVVTEPSLYARAMRLLARREHSRDELHRKLSRIAAEGEDVAAVIEALAAKGWLSDARYAEHAVRAKSRRFGPLKVAYQLRAKGVGDEAIAAAFVAAGVDGTADIQRVWKSRFHAFPENDRELGRHVRFLQGRGFPLDDILRFLRTK
jgi:regulatory protein